MNVFFNYRKYCLLLDFRTDREAAIAKYDFIASLSQVPAKDYEVTALLYSALTLIVMTEEIIGRPDRAACVDYVYSCRRVLSLLNALPDA